MREDDRGGGWNERGGDDDKNRASRRACDHVTSRASRDVLTHIIKLCILKFRLFKYHTALLAVATTMMTTTTMTAT